MSRSQIIVSHGGGTLPYLAGRLSNLIAMSAAHVSPSEAIAQMKSLHYDVTSVSNPMSLASYKLLVPADRRLYGSDYPFMPEKTSDPALLAWCDPANLTSTELPLLACGYAARLFPRFAGPWTSVQNLEQLPSE